MTTRETLQAYFSALEQKGDWPSFLADDIAFTSLTSPVRQLGGRAAYLDGTRRFYSMITAMKVKELIVDGERACALTYYQLQPPSGPAFRSDVAEVFRVEAGKITSFDIYFDTAPYPR
jgi:ketosteroid isomerase-like protein